MAFQKKNFADLYAQLESEARQRVPLLSDYQEGSVIRSLFESFAVELAVLYEQLDLVYRAGFIDTAEGDHLDRVVAVLGLKRNEPDFATGIVTFRRDAGARDALTIPIGALVTTEEDPAQEPSKKAYLTTAEVQLATGATVMDVPVQAEAPGPQMTTEAGTIVVMPRPMPGIKTVTNQAPVRFLGRERESDDALRQRAKQALLASGRASTTALENALLSLPGIRQVRLQEESDHPGVVYIYVDGLTAENEAQVRQRIDEVRAAGIYVVLKVAQSIRLTVILRIRTDPRVKGEEQKLLEQRVATTVEAFIQHIPMGEPLLFAQLTAAVLGVQGIVDLEDFTVTTIRTPMGETAQTTQYTALARRIPAAPYERFEATAVRIAAEIQPLPMDLLVQLSFPVAAVRTQLGAAYARQLAAVKANLANSTTIKALPANVRQPVIAELSSFYDRAQQAVATSDWRVRLDEELQAPLVAATQAYFTDLSADAQVTGGAVTAAAIGEKLQATALDVQQAQEQCKAVWAAQFSALHETLLKTFPSARLAAIMQTGADAALKGTLDSAGAELNATLTQLPPPDSSQQQAAITTLEQSQNAALAARTAIVLNSNQLVDALQQETAANLRTVAERTVAEQVNPPADPSLYARHELVNLSLGAKNFAGAIIADAPVINVSFIEKPTLGALFIYTDRLELEGVIRLLLAPTTSRAEKIRLKSALRQAIAAYLAGLAPAEAIDLARLRALALEQAPVIFDPAALRLVRIYPESQPPQALPDRSKDQKLRVEWSEKVFLAAEPLFTLDIEY